MSRSAGFDVIVWAADHAPTVRRKDGKPDLAAHAVLNALAVWANKQGVARPSLPEIANRARLDSLRAVREALGRLAAAGLISPAGDFNGTMVWQLHTSVLRDGNELASTAKRRMTATEKAAARVRRHRERHRKHEAGDHGDCLPATCNALVERHDSGAEDDVKRSSTALRNALVERVVTPSTPLQAQVTPPVTAIELPGNCHNGASGHTNTAPKAPPRSEIAAVQGALFDRTGQPVDHDTAARIVIQLLDGRTIRTSRAVYLASIIRDDDNPTRFLPAHASDPAAEPPSLTVLDGGLNASAS